eukprot:734179-Hanusia_phi.AAC.1
MPGHRVPRAARRRTEALVHLDSVKFNTGDNASRRDGWPENSELPKFLPRPARTIIKIFAYNSTLLDDS